MTLRLIREPSRYSATLGVLFINGEFFGFTCEDPIREVAGVPVELWKVNGESAIPEGRYRVVVSLSARFKRRLPLLLNVPGFTGIRIHPGNKSADTEGCILPGFSRAKGMVLESKKATEAIQALIELAMVSEPVWIEIVNPS